MTPWSTRASRRVALAVGLLLAGVACGEDDEAATPPPTIPPATDPTDPTPVLAGRYLLPESGWSMSDVIVTLPADWTVQYGHVLSKNADKPSEVSIYPVLVDEIFADPCAGDVGEVVAVGEDEDLVAALLGQPGGLASRPVETKIDGYPAQRVDMSIPSEADIGGCSYADIGLQIWHSDSADKYFVLELGARASVYVVDVDGRRQVILTQQKPAAPEDVRELEGLLDSIDLVTGDD
jgi:hypothetical protein